jgi:hypothetical protein
MSGCLEGPVATTQSGTVAEQPEKHETHSRNGASDGLMCDTGYLRIGKGDVNNANPPEITDALVVKA